MAKFRRSIALGSGLQPHPYLTVGRRVRVQRGALVGIEGVLNEAKNAHRLVVVAEILQRAVSLLIDRQCLVDI